MKIDSPKFAPAHFTPERPQLSTPTKSGNTGIVPSAAQPKPSDTFEKPGTGGVSPNTGIVPTAPTKPQSISTYTLPAHLEAHRATFDRYGEHIAKMPTHVQGKAISNATDHIYRDLGGVATHDEVGKAVSAAVDYFSLSRGTSSNDPQCARVVYSTVEDLDGGSTKGPASDSGSATRSPASGYGSATGSPASDFGSALRGPASDYGRSTRGPASDYGRSIPRNSSSRTEEDTQRSIKRQPRQQQRPQDMLSLLSSLMRRFFS